MDLWLVAVLLLVVAAALLLLELFVPSAGLLGFLSTSACIASIVVVFVAGGPVAGATYLAAVALVVPFLVMAGLRWWPHTPLGRRILNLDPNGASSDIGGGTLTAWQQLKGRTGTAKSKMLPSGAVLIDGVTYDAVSEGMPIELGEPIIVQFVEGNRIVVRPYRASETGAPSVRIDSSEPQLEDPFQDPLP